MPSQGKSRWWILPRDYAVDIDGFFSQNLCWRLLEKLGKHATNTVEFGKTTRCSKSELREHQKRTHPCECT